MKDKAEHAAWRTVAELYRHFFAGLVLRTVAQRGAKDAAELVFRTFRRQHHARFLAGLHKLGLDTLPHAVAAASYHYLSNRIGGVSVEFMPENDRKAWVRFPPPRWVWPGVTICAIPTDVSAAMLRGWQAHNGVSLGNPRLGFVCTGMTPDGQPGLEGYFLEHDRDLAPEERLRFARHESAPPFDPTLRPEAGPRGLAGRAAGQSASRLRHGICPIRPARSCCRPLGRRPHDSSVAARHGWWECRCIRRRRRGLVHAPEPGPAGFARLMVRLAEAQGDNATAETEGTGVVVRQVGWALMKDMPEAGSVLLDCWAGLLEGAAMAHDPRMVVHRDGLIWRIGT